MKWLTSLALSTTLSLTTKGADFSQATTMQSVQAQVEQKAQHHDPEHVWVAFDVDMTLTEPDHPAARYRSILKHKEALKELFNSMDGPTWDRHINRITYLPQRLVEETTPAVIKALQSKGFHVIAFTASLSGKSETAGIQREHRRHQVLRELGIDLTPAQTIAPDITLTTTPLHCDGHPVFYKGLLVSNGERGSHTKGSVMADFLDVVSEKPTLIVLIDDKKKNLEETHQALATRYPAIQFLGIEYQGALTSSLDNISLQDFLAFWRQELALIVPS